MASDGTPESLGEFITKSVLSQLIGGTAYDALKYVVVNTLLKEFRQTGATYEVSEAVAIAFEEEVAASAETLRRYGEFNTPVTVNSEGMRTLLRGLPSAELLTATGLDQLLERLATVFADAYVLEIPGHQLTSLEYRKLILQTLYRTWSTLHSEITGDQRLFNEYLKAFAVESLQDARVLRDQLNQIHQLLSVEIGRRLENVSDVISTLNLYKTFDRLDIIIPEANLELIDSSHTFYRGNVDWNDIIQNYDIRRTMKFGADTTLNHDYAEYFSHLSRAYQDAAKRNQRIFKIFGEAGAGKTTLLMRLAYDLYVSGFPVLINKAQVNSLNAGEIRAYYRETNRPIFLFIDDVATVISIKAIKKLLSELGHTFPIVTIIAAHPARWNSQRRKIGYELIDNLSPSLEYHLGSLTEGEITSLLGLLEKTGNLGKLINYDLPMRISVFFQKLAENQLLIALREAIDSPQGQRRFDEIITEEHASLPTISARDAYSTVALFQSCGTMPPENIIRRSLGYVRERRRFRLDVVETAARVLFVDEAFVEGFRTNVLRTRHSIIGKVIADAEFEEAGEVYDELRRVIESIDDTNYTEQSFLISFLNNETLAERLGNEYLDKLLMDVIRLISNPQTKSLLLHRRAILSLVSEKIEQAEELLLEAIEIDDRVVRNYRTYGWSILWKRKHNRVSALDILRRGLTVNPNNIFLYYTCGMIELESKAWRAAKRFFQEGLSLDNENILLLEGLLTLVCTSGDVSEAVEWSSHAVKTHPTKTDFLVIHATIFWILGKSRNLDFYEVALAINPYDAFARLAYSNALLQDGAFTKAIDQVHAALVLDKDNSVIVDLYSSMTSKNQDGGSVALQNHPDSIGNGEVASFGISRSETNSYLRQVREGCAYLSLGRLDEALKSLERAFHLHEEVFSSLEMLGRFLLNTKSIPQAFMTLKCLVRLSPDNRSVRRNYFLILRRYIKSLRKSGKYEEALEYLHEAYELQPRNSHILENLGEVLSDLGRYDEAIVYYEQAGKTWPDKTRLRAKYAYTLYQLGETQQARDQFRQIAEESASNRHFLITYAKRLLEQQAYEEANILIGFAHLHEPVPNSVVKARLQISLLKAQKPSDLANIFDEVVDQKVLKKSLVTYCFDHFRKAGRNDMAIAIIEAARKQLSLDLHLLRAYAKILIEAGNLGQAIEVLHTTALAAHSEDKPELEALILATPTNLREINLTEIVETIFVHDLPKATVMRSYIRHLRKLKVSFETVSVLETILDEHFPLQRELYIEYALFLYDLDRSSEAFNVFRKLLHNFPQDKILYNHILSAVVDIVRVSPATKGNIDEVEIRKLLEAINELLGTPKDASDLIIRAEVAAKKRNYELAAVYFSDALAKQESSRAHTGYARTLHKLNQQPLDVEGHFLKALELDSENAQAHDWFATFLKETGDTVRAELHERKAVELNPESYVFLNNLALILLERTDDVSRSEAYTLLIHASLLAPKTFPYPIQKLKELESQINSTHLLVKNKAPTGGIEGSENIPETD
jgi:tetratricopeptide (TPR) repeat protein